MTRPWPARNAITKSHLIVCEGATDEAFLRALIKAHGLPDCSIRNAGDTNDGRGGIYHFGKFFKGVPSFSGFVGGVTELLVVADNDLTPDANFQEVRKALAGADPFGSPAASFAVPDKPRETAVGKPNVTILMVPWDNLPGSLETLCLPAAVHAAGSDVDSCCDEFARGVRAVDWPNVNKQVELKLRVMLSAQHQKEPFVTLGRIWNECPDLIPLDHDCFRDVVEFLRRWL